MLRFGKTQHAAQAVSGLAMHAAHACDRSSALFAGEGAQCAAMGSEDEGVVPTTCCALRTGGDLESLPCTGDCQGYIPTSSPPASTTELLDSTARTASRCGGGVMLLGTRFRRISGADSAAARPPPPPPLFAVRGS